jgi:hypothetical protein
MILKSQTVALLCGLLIIAGCVSEEASNANQSVNASPLTNPPNLTLLHNTTLTTNGEYFIDDSHSIIYGPSNLRYVDKTKGTENVLIPNEEFRSQGLMFFKLYGEWNGNLLYSYRLYTERFPKNFLLNLSSLNMSEGHGTPFAIIDRTFIESYASCVGCPNDRLRAINPDTMEPYEIMNETIIQSLCEVYTLWDKCHPLS